jgi:pyrimidine-specific ribonucleoside hydrolase
MKGFTGLPNEHASGGLSNQPIPILIDTDLAFGSENADVDDALAILLALAHPERFDVLAITAVSGNVDAIRASANIKRLLERLGRDDIPHCAASNRPLDSRFWVESRWKAQPKSLMERETAMNARYKTPGFGVDLIRDTLRSANEPVTVVCVGPLTNVALALSIEPDLSSNIRLIAAMGGTHLVSGVADGPAEFNVLVDPEAAALVFTSSVPAALFTLDVTKKQAIEAVDLQTWRSAPGGLLHQLAKDAEGYMSHRAMMYHQDRPYMFFHDAMPMVWLMQPDLFTLRSCLISVDCSGEYTRGVTVVDTQKRAGRELKHWIAVDVDAPAALDLVIQDLTECFGGMA